MRELVSARPSGRRGQREGVRRVGSPCDLREERPHVRSSGHAGAHVERAQRNHQQCTRPNGLRVDGANVRRERNPNDRHGGLQHGRNRGRERGDARASRLNYVISTRACTSTRS